MPIPKELADALASGDTVAAEAAFQAAVEAAKKPLLEKNVELLGEKTKAKQRAELWESLGVDYDAIKEIVDQNRVGEEGRLTKAQLTERYQQEIRSREEKITNLQKALQKNVKEGALRAALQGKVRSGVAMEDALRRLDPLFKLEGEGENTKLAIADEMYTGERDLNKYVESWLKSEVGAEYAAAPNHQGGGQNGRVANGVPSAGQLNPFDPITAVELYKKQGSEGLHRAIETYQPPKPQAPAGVPTV